MGGNVYQSIEQTITHAKESLEFWQTLLKYGVDNNVVVYDERANGILTKRLVALMRICMRNRLDTLKVIVLPEDEVDYKDFVGIDIDHYPYELKGYYNHLGASFPSNKSEFIIGIGYKSLLLGAY